MHETPDALRADARRNREQIIEAARTLFVRIGPDVPMEEIARSAGVGVGTLYRRFPDRGELIQAVNLDTFTRLAELARRTEREEADPAVALASLLRSALEMRLSITVTRMSAHARPASEEPPAVAGYRDEVVAVLGRLLRRAQETGSVRPDIGTGDALMALTLVARMAPLTGDELGTMVFQRLFGLMMDGLRAVSGAPLPGRTVSYGDIEELRQRGRLARPAEPQTAGRLSGGARGRGPSPSPTR